MNNFATAYELKPRTMRKDAHKWLLRFVLAYVPVQNVAYALILALSPDIYEVMTNWLYVYYIISLPLVFTLADALHLCRLYKFGIVNPLIAPMLMLATPRSWDAALANVGICVTAVLVALLLLRWSCNKYHACHNVQA